MTIDSIASSGAAGPAGRSAAGIDSGITAPAGAHAGADAVANPRPAAQRAPARPTEEQLAKAIAELNQASAQHAQGVEFSIDKDSKRTVVKVVDQATREVLRQIPTEQALEIAKSIDQSRQGRLINQTA